MSRTIGCLLVGLAAVGWASLSPPVHAQLVFHPGDVAESLLPTNGACGTCFKRQDCSRPKLDCGTPVLCPSRAICECEVRLGAREIRAHSFACGDHFAGGDHVRAESRVTPVLYADFSISPSTSGEDHSLVGSFLVIDLQWAGFLVGFGGPHATSEYTVQFRVMDVDDGNRVIGSELISLAAERGTFKIIRIKGLPLPVPIPGVDIVRDEVAFRVIPLPLKRGHRYRAQLSLAVRAVGGVSVSSSEVDFGQTPQVGFDRFVKWRKVTLVVGEDPFENVDDLLRKLEGHTHGYQTGRGEGHNNTPAATTEAKFPPD